ncbi:MAG TPA: glycosyltransferase [Thermoanaerobaculia bacterium]|jgi:glycosyltransferase involved in cell wall biosynthesis
MSSTAGGQRYRLLHVITALGCGGAEMMLYKLLRQLGRHTFDCRVVVMMDVGPVGRQIQELGIPVEALGMRRGVPDPRGLARLVRLLRRDPPDLVHAWMIHANLMAGLAARLAGGPQVVWEIQQGPFDSLEGTRCTLWLSWLSARLAPWLAARTVFCAETGRQAHLRLGYRADQLTVIPNGIDVADFHPDAAARAKVRQEIGIDAAAPLVGLFARFHPQKDHQSFIEAAGYLATMRPDVHFLLCGEGISGDNRVLSGWINRAGIADRCHLLGLRDDMPRLTAALDIATSSSTSEGCPNAVGEAMACGVPAVATDVGDCALIVGDTGKVVLPRQPEALARAWADILTLHEETRRALGRRARARILDQYSLDDVTRQYAALYREFLPVRCGEASDSTDYVDTQASAHIRSRSVIL